MTAQQIIVGPARDAVIRYPGAVGTCVQRIADASAVLVCPRSLRQLRLQPEFQRVEAGGVG